MSLKKIEWLLKIYWSKDLDFNLSVFEMMNNFSWKKPINVSIWATSQLSFP